MTTKTPFDNIFGTDNPAFAELKKAQAIVFDAIDQTARKNLEAAEKLLETNRQRLADATDMSEPSEYFSRQSAAVKDYAEQVRSHIEALTEIGQKSREELSEVGSEMAKALDFSSFYPFAEVGGKAKKPAPRGKNA